MTLGRRGKYTLSLQDYLRRRENKNLLAQINAAQAEEMEVPEKNLRRKSKRAHRRVVESEWLSKVQVGEKLK
jgi:hypothetical protein